MTTRIHLIAPFHTKTSDEFSHCAFTGKALRFSQMMHFIKDNDGNNKYEIIEYSNEGSESEADIHNIMLTNDEFNKYYNPENVKSPGEQALVGSDAYKLFNSRLESKLSKMKQRGKLKAGDIFAHVFGPKAHAHLVNQYPRQIHVETGIGYPHEPFGCYQIFESEAWKHYQLGRFGTPGGVINLNDLNTDRIWVIPNYYDENYWTLNQYPQNYVLFMGRFVIDKGIEMLRKVIKLYNQIGQNKELKFMLAGMGNYDEWFNNSDFNDEEKERINYLGAIKGKARVELCGNAIAMLMPTIFIEPFGGSGVESMLTGTPLLASNFGAFTETVEDSGTGFLCRTPEDYVNGIDNSLYLSRNSIRNRAIRKYSLDACSRKYDEVFTYLTNQ